MNDLTQVSNLTTKVIRSIKVKDSDGNIQTMETDQNNLIDLSKVLNTGTIDPPKNYLASGTVLYSSNGSVLPYGKTIILNGVTDNFDNIEKGIEFHFSDKSTSYESGLFLLKKTYYPIVKDVVFNNGNKFPLQMTKEQLLSGNSVDNAKSSFSLDSVSSSGTKSTLSVSNAHINMKAVNGNAISFTSDSRIVSSTATVDWILNEIVVI